MSKIESIFSYLLNQPCIDTRRGFMSVKTISSYPKSEPAIDGSVSLFDATNGRLLLVEMHPVCFVSINLFLLF